MLSKEFVHSRDDHAAKAEALTVSDIDASYIATLGIIGPGGGAGGRGGRVVAAWVWV
jgi:hypothetical protein